MLKVSEYFYSIQGEGEHTGTPAVFLRLSGCNLYCGRPKADDLTTPCDGCKWVCDSIAQWKQGEEMSSAFLFVSMHQAGCIEPLRKGAHLVITGGEPLLQQSGIIEFLEYLAPDITPYVEIETNGTQIPRPDLDNFVDRYNVSPKMSNSGNNGLVRYNKMSLNNLKFNSKTIFKFVVLDDEDVKELLDDYINALKIPKEKVYLMPGAYNREQLYKNGERIAELCKKYHFKMSSRLHVEIWDRLTGV